MLIHYNSVVNALDLLNGVFRQVASLKYSVALNTALNSEANRERVIERRGNSFEAERPFSFTQNIANLRTVRTYLIY